MTFFMVYAGFRPSLRVMGSVKAARTVFILIITLNAVPISCLEQECTSTDPTCNSLLTLAYLICVPAFVGGSAQGCPLQLSGTVTTIAGQAGVTGTADGIGNAATFNVPNGSTAGGNFIYFADATNNSVRRQNTTTLEVATIVTGLSTPRDVVLFGNALYIANASGNTILKYDLAAAALSTVAGSGGAGHADGVGVAAQFNFPQGITSDGIALYVADSGTHTIRRIDLATFAVTTLAGVPNTPGYQDGAGSAARFDGPLGITSDGANVYVADFTNNETIRKIVIATGFVTTIGGSVGQTGSADGIAGAARFASPYALTTDGSNVYVTEFGNHTVRRIALGTLSVTTLSGQAGTPGTADGTGAAATHNSPRGITTDGVRLYVSDGGSHIMRRID